MNGSPALDLNTVWFLLVGVLLTGYALLDGFDLGVGILYLRARGDDHRRILLNAVGPFWDGNEVWLVTAGGALFAAFPLVYASAFSGFYLALMLLLVCLILRAVAIEFRGKRADAAWRRTWDAAFSAGSGVAALLLGVALGNVAHGVPLDERHVYAGSFLDLLHPYALVIGILTVLVLAMHGALYLLLRTEGDLHQQVRRWLGPAISGAALALLLATVLTVLRVPRLIEPLAEAPVLWLVPALGAAALANVAREWRAGRDGRAFLSSCALIVTLMATFGIGMFPDMLPSVPVPANGLTAYNAASSPATLRIMLIIAAVGMPLVIVYTAAIYRVFRGKVRLDGSSY